MPPDTIPISLLNALEYCPRRFYYEFVQGEMLVNAPVLDGTLKHETAHACPEHGRRAAGSRRDDDVWATCTGRSTASRPWPWTWWRSSGRSWWTAWCSPC